MASRDGTEQEKAECGASRQDKSDQDSADR